MRKRLQKLSRILLFANLFLLQAYLIRFEIKGLPTNFQEILVLANAALFFLSTPIKESLNPKKVWPIAILGLLMILSLFTTETFDQTSLLRNYKFFIVAALLTHIFLTTLKTDKETEDGLKTAGLGALAFGLFSLIYNLSGHNVTTDYRLIGPLDSAVYLGYYLAPFAIFFNLKYAKSRDKQHLLIAMSLFALILYTRSVGAIGGVTAITGLYLILNSKISKKLIAIALIGAAAIAFYTKILPTIQTNYSSLDERGEIWATSAALLKSPSNFVFGLGTGQFQHHYETTVEKVINKKPLDFIVLQPHNIILLFWFQYGIIGLLLLTYIILKTLQKPKEPQSYMLAYFLLHGLIDTPFLKNDLLIILFLLICLQTANQIHQSKVRIGSLNDTRGQ